MNAGQLRHRVTIESRQETQDQNTGEITSTWRKFVDVWASVEPLSAREFIAAQATQSQVSARIVIRFLDGVTAKMRIRHGSTVYNIAGVLADKESGRDYLTLPVSAGVDEG